MATIFTPTVGHAYKFTFDSRFSKVDGIYKVDRIYSYDEYLSDGRNIKDDFYSVCDLDISEVNKDLAQLRTTQIIKVSPPDSSTLVKIEYFPMCFVQNTPDYNIKKYEKFGLIAYAGMTSDIKNFEYLRANVEQLFNTCLGIESKPYWVAISSQWMTEDDYNKQMQKQDIAKNKVLNYYSENLRLQRECSSLSAKLEAYEEIIINLHKQINTLKTQSLKTEVSS